MCQERKAVPRSLKSLGSALLLAVSEVSTQRSPLVVLKLQTYNNFSESLQEMKS